MRQVLMVFAVCLAAVGCEKREVTTTIPIAEDDRSYVIMVVLDLSGSFSDLMVDRGKGYEFALAIVDRYFRDRVGTSDRLIIGQISGNHRALLWEGTPHQLRQDFSSAGKFRDFLHAKAEPNASLVHQGVTLSLNYLMSDAAVASGQANSAVFVLSDMVENGPNPAESEKKMTESLTAYGKLDGVMGIYYVDQFLVADWRHRLQEAGIRGTIESEIRGRPTLPSFE